MRLERWSEELLRQNFGLHPMQTATGLESFHRCLELPGTQALVLEGTLSKVIESLQRSATLNLSFGSHAPQDREPPPLAEIKVDQKELQRNLKAILAGVPKLRAPDIELDKPFVALGLDSIIGAEFVVAINRRFGTTISNIRVFDYPNIAELAAFLADELRKRPPSSGEFTSKSPPPFHTAAIATPTLGEATGPSRVGRRTRTSNRQDKIAIVGMSGRYAQANNLQQYWDNLAAGRNSIVEVPRSRWNVDRYYDPVPGKRNKTYSKWLGAMEGVENFDPLFFRISPDDAANMDPQHRLFLQESYRAFEDAGYPNSALSNKKCGVYLGITSNEYSLVHHRNKVTSANITSNNTAIAAARIAYYLNLKGPAISVDTACSSSLVAIHLACQGLLSHETDMALAGGVSLWLSQESYLAMSEAGMLSPQGQCKTFDDSADGIVVGDGVGAVVLKRLRDAEADRDVIHGVILGSGINQDGRTNGITAPSVNSQIELLREVYSRHGVDPRTVSYVETHGTGTRLGDPIELEALATAFREKTTKRNYCALASVKSNIGHTAAAAGVASVQKVLLSMRHRTLAPTLHVTSENTQFDFDASPFYINKQRREWAAESGRLRRAGVSSFGFSGTNAHLVLEEYSARAAGRASGVSGAVPGVAQTLVPLSAQTIDQLEQKASDLLAFLCSAHQMGVADVEALELRSIAYTLQTGREPMLERVAFQVGSVDQLIERLSAYVAGSRDVEGIYQGRVDAEEMEGVSFGSDVNDRRMIVQWMAGNGLSKLASMWVKGLGLDWNGLYDDDRPQRMSLPTYPFAAERHWIEEPVSDRDVQIKIDGTGDLASIERILGAVEEDSLDTQDAVRLLKMLV